MRRSHAFIAATLLAGTAVLAGCSSQGSSAEPGRQAADGQTCDWTGTGGSILDASNAALSTLDLNAMASEAAGVDVTVTGDPKARELDLFAEPGPTAPSATDPMGLSRAEVTYSMTVQLPDGNTRVWSVQNSLSGLCFNDATVHMSPWVGSTGVTNPTLELGAALEAADKFRAANPDVYNPGYAVVSANLLQATTAPPDFGLPRWYINYADPANPMALEIVAVYMDGKAINPRG